jgi:sensor histidine kinase YesM
MAILDVYLEIMEARFGQGLRVSRDLDPTAAEVQVPALLLQPLVENAIRHGEPERKRPMEISIRASRQRDCLRLEVADNGPGLSSDPGMPEGVGLRSIRDRLAQLYGEKARLILENLSPRGLLAAIELPLETGMEMPAGSKISAVRNAPAAEAVP